MELPMILPFAIMGSTHLCNSDNPSSCNYEINTHSQVPKSLDLFWTEVQGWYNPTTFSMTEVHRIHSEPKFKDDTILPHSRWPKFTEVQGWYNPATFLMTEVHRICSELNSKDDTILPPSQWPKFTGSVLNWSSRMIQSYHLLDDQSSLDHF